MIFKKVLVLVLLLYTSGPAFSQDSSIPKGIKYKATSTSNNEKAKLILKDAISKNISDSIFDDICYIGPILWIRYKEKNEINSIKGGNIQFNVPVFDKQTKKKVIQPMNGKLIQNRADFKIIWSQVRADLQDSITFKKLTANQLTYYWAIIFFDIEEPVFIADNGKHKLLLQLSPRTNKILWIDEVFD